MSILRPWEYYGGCSNVTGEMEECVLSFVHLGDNEKYTFDVSVYLGIVKTRVLDSNHEDSEMLEWELTRPRENK